MFDDHMMEVWDLLMVAESYRKLDEMMQAKSITTIPIVQQFMNDSQYTHSVEARLYVTGVVGSDGHGTWAIWKKLLMWIVDTTSDTGANLFGAGSKHDSWSSRLAEDVGQRVQDHYNIGQGATNVAADAVGWVIKVLRKNSEELRSVMFFEGSGPPLHQDCKFFNFDHLQHLFQALAEGMHDVECVLRVLVPTLLLQEPARGSLL